MKTGRPRRAEAAMIDWAAIKARALAGETFGRIANDFPVSRHAIEKRAKKEMWLENAEQDPAFMPARWLPLIQKCGLAAKVHKHPGRFSGTFRADVAACVLSDMAYGNSMQTACALHGVSKDEFRSWRAADTAFDSLVRAAIAECRRSLMGAIKDHAQNDWKAAAWLLERLPDHKEEFAAAEMAAGKGGITVNISVRRDETLAIEGGVREVIDVTPEDKP